MPRQIPLTTLEERKLAELSRTLHASLWLQYDYNVVEKGRHGGELSIGIEQANMPLEKTLCQSDSASLRSAQLMANEFFPLLRFKENHDSIAVTLLAVQREVGPDSTAESLHIECTKQFVARLKSGSLQFRLVSRSSNKPNWYW